MYLTQALHRAVQQTPDLPATIFGDRTRSWAECGDRVARFAAALQALDVAPGDRVAILAGNSDRYHEYLLAVPWAGGVLNPVNIRWSPAEIAYSLRDSDTRVLLVDDAFVPVVAAVRDECPELRTVIHCGDGATPDEMLGYEELVATNAPAPDAYRGGDELAGIFYTGGTTGPPKGVMLSHANLITSALGSTAGGSFLTPHGRLLHAAPMFHLADLAAWIARCMLGGTHVIVPMFDPAAVIAAIRTHEVHDALLVPVMIQLLADSPAAKDADLPSMRRVTYGASPISEAVLERARAVLPSASFTQAYGMTELSPVATLLDPADHDHPTRRRSAGRAAPHAQVRVVDEDDREVARGTIGEVVVRGGHVMLGYWNRPDETAVALRGGWMHTGDGAYMDDEGYVYVVDRIKDMIISGGENVYSVEVENAVAKHPAVASCAVIGVPDDHWGERVHAVVVLQPGTELSAADLREHTKTLIAGYKAPRSIDVVEALPVSSAGKVLKRDLRARYWPADGRAVR